MRKNEEPGRCRIRKTNLVGGWEVKRRTITGECEVQSRIILLLGPVDMMYKVYIINKLGVCWDISSVIRIKEARLFL